MKKQNALEKRNGGKANFRIRMPTSSSFGEDDAVALTTTTTTKRTPVTNFLCSKPGSCLDLRLLLLDLRIQIRSGELLQLENLLLHLRLAKVHLRRAAHRLQALRELLKRCEVSAPLVVLEAV